MIGNRRTHRTRPGIHRTNQSIYKVHEGRQIGPEEPTLRGEGWQRQFHAVHLIQQYTQCVSHDTEATFRKADSGKRSQRPGCRFTRDSTPQLNARRFPAGAHKQLTARSLADW